MTTASIAIQKHALSQSTIPNIDKIDLSLRLDLSKIVLRTDCVSSPLLVYIASTWRKHHDVCNLAALVADDFQPSILYNEFFLGPYVDSLTTRAASAIRFIWARALWALFVDQQWPLTDVFRREAVDFLSHEQETHVGNYSRIMASKLVPPQRSELAPQLDAIIRGEIGGRQPNGLDVREWLHSRAVNEWASLGKIDPMIRHPIYRDYFANSDPFFEENIEPFDPGAPLYLLSRAGNDAVTVRGLPSYSDRYRSMIAPKVRTLRSWGWDIREFGPMLDQGTSYSGGGAQSWAISQVKKALCWEE